MTWLLTPQLYLSWFKVLLVFFFSLGCSGHSYLCKTPLSHAIFVERPRWPSAFCTCSSLCPEALTYHIAGAWLTSVTWLVRSWGHFVEHVQTFIFPPLQSKLFLVIGVRYLLFNYLWMSAEFTCFFSLFYQYSGSGNSNGWVKRWTYCVLLPRGPFYTDL